jgi:hypothetical protein
MQITPEVWFRGHSSKPPYREASALLFPNLRAVVGGAGFFSGRQSLSGDGQQGVHLWTKVSPAGQLPASDWRSHAFHRKSVEYANQPSTRLLSNRGQPIPWLNTTWMRAISPSRHSILGPCEFQPERTGTSGISRKQLGANSQAVQFAS